MWRKGDRMAGLCAVVKRALAGVRAQVFYYYPASWVRLPCMAWRESGNRELARADGREYLTEVTYTIDIWSASPEENGALAESVQAVLAAEGFMRTYSADLYETASRLHHRVLRYRAVAGADGRVYQ